MSIRLDQKLTSQLNSRTKAQDLIKEGKIKVNSKVIRKPSYKVLETDIIEIAQDDNRYVSRAGGKLLAALDQWKIDLKDQVVLDIGASTGGFTQCSLDHGASKVYALDVGHLQLHPLLKEDERVIEMEGMNARFIEPDWFRDPIDFVCMDVSFISCMTILEPVMEKIFPKHMAVLVKPQFELGPQALNKSGVLKQPAKALETVDRIKREIRKKYEFVRYIPSPVLGRNGNQEYILYASNNPALYSDPQVKHQELI